MVLPSVLAQPICLRCQLYEAIASSICNQGIRRLPFQQNSQPKARPFSQSPRIYEEQHDGSLEPTKRSPISTKIIVNNFVGRPPRRRRISSERLATASLHKPSDIIVLRDIEEEPRLPKSPPSTGDQGDNAPANSKSPPTNTLSAQDIADAVAEGRVNTEEEEVHASVDALRPISQIVDEREYKQLFKKLKAGYTSHQLSRYIVRRVQSQSHDAASASHRLQIGRAIKDLNTSKWRKGQSRINLRIASVVKEDTAVTKSKIAEQVLRLAWNITIQSEEQELGELEMQLQPWQLQLLVDLQHESRPNYQHFISPQMLIDASVIEPYKPHNILRITARRRDAEDIARQLRHALLHTQRSEMDLKGFAPLLERPGRLKKLKQLFDLEEVTRISRLTRCIIHLETDNIVAIYGTSSAGTMQARQLLLSHLNLSSPQSYKSLYIPNLGGDVAAPQTVPSSTLGNKSPASQTLPHRLGSYRSSDPIEKKDGSMKIEPTPAADIDQDDDTIKRNSKRLQDVESSSAEISQQLHAIDCSPDVDHSRIDEASYWRTDIGASKWSSWHASFCGITRPWSNSTSPSAMDSKGNDPVSYNVHHRIPNIHNLLAILRLRKNSPQIRTEAQESRKVRDLYLIAYFVPSPLTTDRTKVKALPRLEATFKITASGDVSGSQVLQILGIKAILDRQELGVPLPGFSNDLCFARELASFADIARAREDEHISTFTQHLREIVLKGVGALLPKPTLIFKVPGCFMNLAMSKSQKVVADAEFEYLFEKFEQTQELDYRFMLADPSGQSISDENRHALNATSKQYGLRYSEIEGGSASGFTSKLTVRFHGTEESDVLDGPPLLDNTSQLSGNSNHDLTKTALLVTEMLNSFKTTSTLSSTPGP